MRTRARVGVVALASMLLVGAMAAPVLARQVLPFRAEADRLWETPIGPVDDCDPGFPVGQDAGYAGTGTYLGRFTGWESLCIGAGIFYVDGVFVAANGDQLWWRVDGTFDPSTMEVFDEEFAFAGGTGRFTSAQGTAVDAFTRDSTGKAIALTVSGTISYDASDRSY
jgi:hypothetical protein